VRERTARRPGKLLGDPGVSLSGAPESEVLEVQAGRVV
jgi:hypothetical protein